MLLRGLRVAEAEPEQMPHSPIELKGSNFTLSVVHLYSAKPDLIRQALKEKLQQAPVFLKNAPVVINVARLPDNADWQALWQVITASGLRAVGISGCRDEIQKQAITQAGLPLLSEGKQRREAADKPVKSLKQPHAARLRALVIDTPVRSGQQIRAINCDLIVTSNISAGAELIADGNIHVYGALRGRALAGSSGDAQCQIFCTQLNSELISIAGQYWLSEQIPADYFGHAARFSLLDNSLTVQPLNESPF